MSLTEVAQQIINGLSLGSTYALLALGLAVVFSVLGLLNFAYGELVTVTGYAMLVLTALGVAFPVAAVMAIAAAALAALIMEIVAFRPLRRASFVIWLFSSLAVAIIIQNLIRQTVSPRPRGVAIPQFFAESVTIGTIRVGILPLVTIAVGGAALLGLVVFFRRSRVGIAMRAASQNFMVARLMGVRANRMIALAFVISGVLAGIAGILWISRTASVSPTMGFSPILKAFIASVVGGLGSLSGAVAGGFLLGALEVTLRVVLPADVRGFTDPAALLLVVAILYFRPHGLMGRPVEAQ